MRYDHAWLFCTVKVLLEGRLFEDLQDVRTVRAQIQKWFSFVHMNDTVWLPSHLNLSAVASPWPTASLQRFVFSRFIPERHFMKRFNLCHCVLRLKLLFYSITRFHHRPKPPFQCHNVWICAWSPYFYWRQAQELLLLLNEWRPPSNAVYNMCVCILCVRILVYG